MRHRFGMKCFDDNQIRFADSETNPEKWNLYTGLAGMAEDLESLASMVQQLQQEVGSLRQGLG